ncbi:MAG: NAD-dependent DNA ligase LigA [Filifactoraceae bacterium]
MNKRVNELREKINLYNKEYYENNNSLVEDEEFDQLLRELLELEKELDIKELEGSPTQKVGGRVSEGFVQIRHREKLLSLGNVFSEAEIRDFTYKIEKEVGNVDYVVELKFDGLTVALNYEKGELKTGATRGDGIFGEDVTNNVKMIRTVPQKLKTKESIVVRGEVFMKKEEFQKLNSTNEIAGGKIFANPRNAASGSLRQLDSNVTKERKLDVAVFNLEYIEGKTFSNHWESLNYLEELGFLVSPNRKRCSNVDEIIDIVEQWTTEKENFEFEIDGIVIKVDDILKREKLSSTSKIPRWAVAYKFPAERKETKILDVEIQVGRTGAITPTAILEPINISGSMVARASLHNFEYIKEKDIRIGDMVVVRKAGEIIPEIVNVNFEKRVGTEEVIEEPVFCPSCNDRLYKNDDDVAIRCVNMDCSGINKRKLIHFASKNAMDIVNMGEAVVNVLYDKNIIRSLSDIYELEEAQLLEVERFGKKSVANLIKAIENSKKQDLYRLIFSLGIEFIGINASKSLANRYETLEDLIVAKEEELLLIEDFGVRMAESVIKYFSRDENIYMIKKLIDLGLNTKKIKEEKFSEILVGEKFVLTGTLPNLKRKDASDLIEKNGGRVLSSVTKEATVVLSGEESGSKLDKAKKLGIKIIDEAEFLNWLNK